ncbi:MAG: hypothetical protein P8188_10950, partial [Gemmatimonadota bacterium]
VQPAPRRAGPAKSILYVLIPPVLGAFVAGLLLRDPAAVPWVLGGALVVGLVAFLLATPLATRSNGLRNAGYRRAAELAILVGLVAGAVVAYTLVVYLLLGFHRAWSAELVNGLVGG